MAYLLKEDADRLDAIEADTTLSLQDKADAINKLLFERQFGGSKVLCIVANGRLRLLARKGWEFTEKSFTRVNSDESEGTGTSAPKAQKGRAGKAGKPV